jgi:hypothetical protein
MELNDLRPAQPSRPAQEEPAPRMPSLATGTAAYEHSLDSALVTLETLGVKAHRIRVRRAGRDARHPGAIVRQKPEAGEPLLPGTLVDLEVAGPGFTQALPVGMWDSGGEAAAGTREILEVLDDPLEKLKHWFGEGAPLFRLSPDDLAACGRWLQLFGLRPAEWPEAMWFKLAAMVADLPQLACSEEGCRFALAVLLELPVQSFTYKPVWAAIPETAISRLGAKASRLGIDLVAGDVAEDLAMTVLEIGPVPLATYERYAESEEGSALLERVFQLILPLSPGHEVRWAVQDATRPPRLGVASENSRLGVNTHMGSGLPGRAREETA